MVIERPAPAASAPTGPIPVLAPARPGYDASPAVAERRIRRLLETEPVVWLSTVRRDGLPALVPTWFWWDGEALTVFSKPEAGKVANLRANPRLMVALGHPEEDFDVGLIEAEALVCRDLVEIPDAFFAKYRNRLADAGMGRATFRATYTQAIRITPRRYLGWHGRGPGHERAARVSPVRRWLADARARIASLRGPAFPRIAGTAWQAAAGSTDARLVTMPLRRAVPAPRLPAWA